MNFLSFAMSLVASPSVPNPPAQIPQGMAWCSSKLCDQPRVYDVLPPRLSETNKPTGIPPFAFCCFCGMWLPDVFPEDTEDIA